MMALRRMAYLSVAAALVTMGLKFLAFWLTGSVSLFSDAAESSVNLLAGLIALAAITVAHRPADEDHAYGHDKAEYFSSGAEGALILVAAATIAYAAIERFANPAPLADLGPGLLVATVAAGVNWVVATVMLRVGRQYDSITIEADAHHLMTDVWTSGGVIAGLLVVMLSPSWAILDPIIACVVAVKIVYTGVDLVRRLAGVLAQPAHPQVRLAPVHRPAPDRPGRHHGADGPRPLQRDRGRHRGPARKRAHHHPRGARGGRELLGGHAVRDCRTGAARR